MNIGAGFTETGITHGMWIVSNGVLLAVKKAERWA